MRTLEKLKHVSFTLWLTTINSSKNIINYICFPEGSVICYCCLLTELPKTTLRSLSIGGCKEKYPLRKKSILQIIDCKSQKRLLSMFTALRFWPFDLFLSIVGPICQIRIFQKQLWAQFLSFVKDSIIVCEKNQLCSSNSDSPLLQTKSTK